MTPGKLFLLTAFSVAACAANAQPFDQKGPTGDNRAATGNPGTQAPPQASGKEAAKQKTPMKKGQMQQPATPAASNSGSAAPTASPGTPAENSAQPEGAK